MRSAKRTGLIASALLAVALVVAAGYAGPPAAQPETDRDALTLRTTTGLLYHGDAPFSGIAVQHTSKGTERATYDAGRRDGLTERWYPNGTLGYRATYTSGRRHGSIATWWPDGTPRSESHYAEGVAHGTQREWYRSGALFKELNLSDGKEAGLQRAWRENGKLYANYEARNGRIYGLKRADLCYSLNDEVIQLTTNTSS